jgi:DNA-binding transcriptional ArsR family regulator
MSKIEQMDYELVKALSHPIRMQILQALQGRVASPAEISEEIGERVGVVSYHTSLLVQVGYLQLVERKRRGGGIENFFSIPPGSFGSPGAGDGPL